jgi:hypothetical protein
MPNKRLNTRECGMKRLLLCALLLGGCAAQTLPLPPLHTGPVQAQFGLRFSYAGMSIPLQGAVRMTDNEGNLGVIFPHGRTLGVCRYQKGGMECVPAGGGMARARVMLQQIGVAVYRMLPALAGESTRSMPEDMTETDWAVRWQETDIGRKAEYTDWASHVTMEMHFTEITRP